MTYREKLLQAIKIDKELLKESEAKYLEKRLEDFILGEVCPGYIFDGASRFYKEIDYGVCRHGKCSDCWNREAI